MSTDNIESPYISNPNLLKSLIDLDCDCVANIRNSECDRDFVGFANCHNRVLITASRRRKVADLTECLSRYGRMVQCLDSIGLKDRQLVKDNQDELKKKAKLS